MGRIARLGWIALLVAGGCSSPPAECAPACAAGSHCAGGACVPDAPADLAMGGDGPTGDCSPKCSGLAPFCNATKHCVACLSDGDCAKGSVCKIVSDAIATCTPGCNGDGNCASGQKCCAMRCVDPAIDVKHCGGCDMPCSGAHSTATCAAGMCAPGKCDPGWGDCNMMAGDGCEANLHADVAHCTACGMACDIPNAFAGCADGCYATSCKFGFDDCNLNAMDGCETSVLSDKNNCGGCGKPCLNLPNASSSCTNGSCLLAMCNFGFANCDGMAANGCEVNTNSNASHCGACGNACPMGNICVQGGCTCPMCNIPNASAKCINNMCVFDKCNPGYADCNNNTGDGCEVALQFDKANCGMCGNACPMMTPFCANGMCSNLGTRVLIVYAASQNYMMDVKMRLAALNAFTQLDSFDAAASTPSLQQLQMYDALLVFSDGTFRDPAALGNVVAQYWDGGGRVVVATFANASLAITGNWTQYQLVQPGGQEQPNDSLGQVVEPNSPLMVGVQALSATSAFRSTGAAINGGVVVAKWMSGKPLVVRGVFKGRNVVTLNFYPPGSGNTTGRQDFWIGDGDKLMRNALLFL